MNKLRGKRARIAAKAHLEKAPVRLKWGFDVLDPFQCPSRVDKHDYELHLLVLPSKFFSKGDVGFILPSRRSREVDPHLCNTRIHGYDGIMKIRGENVQ